MFMAVILFMPNGVVAYVRKWGGIKKRCNPITA
jgi:hypothetical protein